MKIRISIRDLALCILALSLFSCNGNLGEKKEESSVENVGSNSPGTTTIVGGVKSSIPIGAVDAGLATKTFNQYNASLSKLTGIESGHPDVNEEYLAIRNSLPADHDSAKYTSFHQVAITRLAFAYCQTFIDSDPQFSALNYTSLSGSEIVDLLTKKFVGETTADNSAYIGKISSELNLIMNNDAGKNDLGESIGQLIPNTNGAALKINLTKLSCTALLSSSEISVL